MNEVRVRFAPSPTGSLHVGGARTALFNWLFARNQHGVFVLRIEDTDAARSTRESEEALLEDLRWIGLTWDEGPGVGGPFEPYRQTERSDIYRARLADLEEEGRAYPCFCTEEELDRKRGDQNARGRPPRYDGTCRRLAAEESRRRVEAGVPHSWRFAMESFGGGEDVYRVDDLIRGPVNLPFSMVGDFVLMRSNGLPTYNFAAVVDDHGMRISHVLRGEEHLSNTLRQGILYRALRLEPPRFGHLPLIHGPDRTKLSKRHGAASVAEYRRAGYLPEAFVNYLALLGWSSPEEREIMRTREIVSIFALDRISKSPSIFDRKKLDWVNGRHVRKLDREDFSRLAGPYLPQGVDTETPEGKLMLQVAQESIEKFEDLEDVLGDFIGTPEFENEEARALANSDQSRGLLEILAQEVECADDDDWFQPALKRAGKRLELKGKGLFMPVRAALTGRLHGPSLADIAEVRGREWVSRRLRQVSAGEVT